MGGAQALAAGTSRLPAARTAAGRRFTPASPSLDVAGILTGCCHIVFHRWHTRRPARPLGAFCLMRVTREPFRQA